MDRNKLALLTNQLGGYDEVERAIGVDAELIARAVEGDILTNLEEAEIEDGFNYIIRHPREFQNRWELDPYELFGAADYEGMRGQTDLLYDVQDSFDGDTVSEDEFRIAVAEQRVNITDFEDLELLFKDGYATRNITERLLEWLNDDDTHSANEFLELFRADGSRLRGDNLIESLFWAWYRETFY